MKTSTRWSEKIADRLRKPKVYALALAITGAIFLALALYGTRFFHRTFDWQMAVGCLFGALLAGFALIVTDYIFIHARLVFVPMVLFLLALGFTEPRFGIGMALVLWGMAVQGRTK